MLRKSSMVLAAVVGLALLAGGVGCGKDEGLKIRKIEPREGPFAGGDPVTIYGSGFQSGGTKTVTVYFGGKKARVLEFDGDDKLIVSPPGGNAGDKVKLTLVFSDSRRIDIDDAYTYIDPAPLKVDDLGSGTGKKTQ